MNNFVAFSWASSKLSLKRHAKKIQKYNLCVLMKHSVGCIPSCIWRSIFGRQENITVLETLADMLFDSAYGEHVIPKLQKKNVSVILSKFSFPQGKKIQKTTAAEDLTSFIPCFKIHTLKALFQSFINSTVNYTCLCCFLWHQTLVLFGQINFINIVSIGLMTWNAG